MNEQTKQLDYKEIHKLALYLVDDSFKRNDESCKDWITLLQMEITDLNEVLSKMIEQKNQIDHKKIHQLSVFLVDDSFNRDDELCKKWITLLQTKITN